MLLMTCALLADSASARDYLNCLTTVVIVDAASGSTLRSRLAKSEHVYEKSERRREPASAWIIDVITRKRLALTQ